MSYLRPLRASTKFGLAAVAALIAALLIAPQKTVAASYPDRPIHIVVPYTPGGAVDVLARALGSRITADWGQQVVVDNRPGASGSVGAQFVAQSKPDGYTLLLSTNAPLTTNVALYKLKYKPLRDFAPIILAAEGAQGLVVNPKLPVHSVADLIALAKKEPGKLRAGSSGVGTDAALALVEFDKMAGVNIVLVPYRGGVQSLTGVMSGDVQMAFSDIVPALPLIRAGKLRILATTGLKRAGAAPKLPTLNESGLNGFDITAWIGMVARHGTPKSIVDKLNFEINKIIREPEFRRQLAKTGIDLRGDSPHQFAGFLRKEIPRWAEIVKLTGAKVQ